MLWVFALVGSDNRAQFTDHKTGRVGLEPVTPAVGSEVAWSLNLHQPYRPTDPVDSIEVAARAINDIIAGATVTDSNGRLVVQPGLEGTPADCRKYTGSAATTSRGGYPPLCREPVTSPGGDAALVADTYRKWAVGASATQVRDAAVLFEDADNPGDPQVQRILAALGRSHT